MKAFGLLCVGELGLDLKGQRMSELTRALKDLKLLKAPQKAIIKFHHKLSTIKLHSLGTFIDCHTKIGLKHINISNHPHVALSIQFFHCHDIQSNKPR
jgi:hypothetical protein